MSHSPPDRQPQLSGSPPADRQDNNISLAEGHDMPKMFTHPGHKAIEHDTSARVG